MNDKVIETGGNIGPLKKAIAQAVADVTKLKEERAAVNEQIGAIRLDLEAKGIPRKAFDRVMADQALDPEVRNSTDLAYAIAREAVGHPLQGDLFEQAGAEAGGE